MAITWSLWLSFCIPCVAAESANAARADSRSVRISVPRAVIGGALGQSTETTCRLIQNAQRAPSSSFKRELSRQDFGSRGHTHAALGRASHSHFAVVWRPLRYACRRAHGVDPPA